MAVNAFHARVVQHECDHLDGMLYPDRIEDRQMYGFIEELQAAGLLGVAVLPREGDVTANRLEAGNGSP